MRFSRPLVLLAFLALLFSRASCGSDVPFVGGAISGSALIGPEGGTIRITSGPLAGTELIVPAGALASTIRISLEGGVQVPDPAFQAVGPGVKISPSGMSFLSPITLTIPFEASSFPPGATTLDLVGLLALGGGGTQPLVPVDVSGSLLTVTFTAFSAVQAKIPVVTVTSFEAVPDTLLSGGSSTLSWTSEHATSCAIDQSIGAVATSGSSGPLTVSATTTYEITCQGLGGPDAQSVTVTVTPPVAINSFSAAPTTIAVGESVMLSWDVDYATSCAIDGGVGTVTGAAGSIDVTPATTQTYELTCQGAGGPVSQQATVTVVVPVTIDSFDASPMFLDPGNDTTLSWTASEATSCEINPGAINATPVAAGSVMVTINNSTLFTLTCQGPAGPVEATQAVWVPGEAVDGMAPIPAGCFEKGPPGNSVTTCVGAFALGTHEITNAQYILCMDAGACGPPTHYDAYANPGFEDYPIVMVSWYNALEYCNWRGRRLPTDTEWEYGARGGLEGYNYPWGNTATPADANCCGFGSEILPVGQYPPNGYGIYDVTGNIWEWVDTDATGARKYVLGGAYDTAEGWCTVWSRDWGHAAGDYYASLGFRCAE